MFDSLEQILEPKPSKHPLKKKTGVIYGRIVVGISRRISAAILERPPNEFLKSLKKIHEAFPRRISEEIPVQLVE